MRVLIAGILISMAGTVLYAQSKPESELASQEVPEQKFQAGVHYELLSPAWESAEKEAVVYEFFSYMCPGCNAFEPYMEQLQGRMNESQKIIRVPVAFYPQWEPHAKAFHALKMMDELDRVHKALFAAIHQYKKPLRTLEDLAAWLSDSFGIDEQKFLATAKSFAVDSQMRRSKKMAQAMGVGRVPTLVVNGQYKPSFDTLKTPDNILAATVNLLEQK